MYMWRIFKEILGTGKRSDAVRSNVQFASAFFYRHAADTLSQDQSAVCNAFKQQYRLSGIGA